MSRRNIRRSGGRQQRSARSGEKQSVLSRLTDLESSLVLHTLLDRHETLREDAENLATETVNTPSCKDISAEVADAVTSLDMEDLNGRAGATRWGYTEPSEAAWELLEEAVEDFLEDMKRRAELGLTDAAITMCRGIVTGLYRARNTPSDGRWGGHLTSLPKRPGTPCLNSCDPLPIRHEPMSVRFS